ncbi:hypothetical protein [Roseinatronobacter monicus]|nr:hypothetical protein [Roseinatronobacter monicus]
MTLIPNPAGQNSDLADPFQWLSTGQLNWATSVAESLGLSGLALQQGMAQMQRHLGDALGLEQSRQIAEGLLQQQLEFQGLPSPEAQAEAKRQLDELLARPKPEPEKKPGPPGPPVVPGPGPQITERKKDDPCEVGPYSRMSRKCAARGGQAHHIVPDFTLRAGPRPALSALDPTRLPNAPTLAQGMAICLTGHARATDRTGEHYAAHRVTDLAIAEAGLANTALPGTATWEDVRKASLAGIKAAKRDCLPAATAAIDAQFAGMPGNQALRAVIDYRTLPQGTRDLLQAGHRL